MIKKNKVIEAFYEDIINNMPPTETIPYEPWDKYGEICPLDIFVMSLGEIFAPAGVRWDELYDEEIGYEPFLKDLREIIENFTKEDLMDAEDYYKLAKEILDYAYDRLEGGG